MTPTDSGSGTITPAAAPATPVTISRVGYTRTELREMVARVFGLHDDYATGGSTTTIVDTKLTRFADDFFNGTQSFIRLTTGAAPEGDRAWVTDFVSSTGTLTVSPTMTGAVVSGDRYQLFFRVSYDDINDALDKVVATFEVATSLVAKDNSLDYYVTMAPLLLRRQQLIAVWRRDLKAVDSSPVEVVGWTFEDAQGQLTLRMPYTMNTNDGLWITYYAGEHSLEDCEYVNAPMMLIRAWAVVYLLENKLNNTTDRDWYGTQLRYWTEKLKQEESKFQRITKRARQFPWLLASGGSRASAWDSDMEAYRTY